ncbi:MAG: hypothetical protein JWM16_1599 [Verrucomicrobiales bacterium]|nr:hypothetical protein [Verrucomicrobiales bacterium]
MPNRLPQPSKAFGLIAWLEETRLQLPLKAVECRFTVCGELLNVEMDQVFRQSNPQALDCLYSFPLPGTAAVYKCEMDVNGRLIEAKVEEQEEARRIVKEKKAAGFRTGLVELERDNLFTLSLGNLQPDDLVVVRLAYFQTLTRLKDWTSFNIPFCPGVRYIPGAPLLRSNSGKGVVDDTDQVPDASRISPPRIDKLNRDAASLYVEGMIQNPNGELVDVSSPSHPLVVHDLPGAFEVSIAEGAAVPDRDLVVRWTDQAHEKLAPAGWRTQTEEATYALARLKAPGHAEVNEAYEQDVYFLIDRSGSMQGIKWQKAVQALLAFLRVLGKGDRAWVTFFETSFQDLAEKPLPAKSLLQDRAVLNIAKLGVAGGTELLPALNHVLEKAGQFSVSRPASLLIITDGQVGNEQAILERLAKHPTLRVHTFGIDTAVNDAFLNKAAVQQRGQSCLLTPNDDIAGAVSRLGDRLRRPVLTSIRVLGDWESPSGSIPDLHTEEVANLPFKGKPGARQLELEGTSADGRTQRITIHLAESKSPALAKLWAKQRIEHLLANNQAEAGISLARQHNLVCRGVAFVAWDEQEKVAVASPERTLYQPSVFAATFGGISAGVARARLYSRMAPTTPETFRFEEKLANALRAGKPRASQFKSEVISKLSQLKTVLGFQAKVGVHIPKVMSQSLIRSLTKEFGGQVSHPDWPEKIKGIESLCDHLFEIGWMRNPAGYALLQIVCRWALEELDAWEEREKRLIRFNVIMEEGDCDQQSLRAWILANLNGRTQTEALAQLEALKMEITGAKP